MKPLLVCVWTSKPITSVEEALLIGFIMTETVSPLDNFLSESVSLLWQMLIDAVWLFWNVRMEAISFLGSMVMQEVGGCSYIGREPESCFCPMVLLLEKTWTISLSLFLPDLTDVRRELTSE